MSKEQSKDSHIIENEKQEQDKASVNAIVETNDYESDHYSKIVVNDHVGNIDTLGDEADIDNKYDKMFTFAPGRTTSLKGAHLMPPG